MANGSLITIFPFLHQIICVESEQGQTEDGHAMIQSDTFARTNTRNAWVHLSRVLTSRTDKNGNVSPLLRPGFISTHKYVLPKTKSEAVS